MNEFTTVRKITQGEIEIMRMSVNGMRAKEIGEKLEISHRTVENHIERMRMKTGARNSYELTAFFFRNNLIK